ncbi:hypothetical protein CSKR_107168 [Clonorchis sinensis]|uniref:Uncharacterized protein n=2 Tax=Clonorchis sinensis TaxID=79923 RepID=A0A8T1M2L8_CLOSI|nr:hypothetical protein CSKR_107168 [Clonorchis sinensis]GAA48512.1 hypothetical protein CLF_101699 [Clonorchis sinensis]
MAQLTRAIHFQIDCSLMQYTETDIKLMSDRVAAPPGFEKSALGLHDQRMSNPLNHAFRWRIP